MDRVDQHREVESFSTRARFSWLRYALSADTSRTSKPLALVVFTRGANMGESFTWLSVTSIEVMTLVAVPTIACALTHRWTFFSPPGLVVEPGGGRADGEACAVDGEHFLDRLERHRRLLDEHLEEGPQTGPLHVLEEAVSGSGVAARRYGSAPSCSSSAARSLSSVESRLRGKATAIGLASVRERRVHARNPTREVGRGGRNRGGWPEEGWARAKESPESVGSGGAMLHQLR
jgi:hypothetical protein